MNDRIKEEKQFLVLPDVLRGEVAVSALGSGRYGLYMSFSSLKIYNNKSDLVEIFVTA